MVQAIAAFKQLNRRLTCAECSRGRVPDPVAADCVRLWGVRKVTSRLPEDM